MPFPINPTNGQTATVNGISYTYNSSITAWVRNTSSAVTIGTSFTGNNVVSFLGNVGFTSGYTYSSGTINIAGQYDVTTNANNVQNTYYGKDHTGGNGSTSQRFISANPSNTAYTDIWTQTVTSVQPNTRYYFTM